MSIVRVTSVTRWQTSTSSSSARPAATSPRSARRSSGSRTACIDEWKTADGKPAPGGTCTNVGCIPSQGAAAVVRELRARRARLRRARHPGEGPRARPRADAQAQGQGRAPEQRRHPLSLQEEQGHVLPRPRQLRGRRRRAAIRSRSRARPRRRSTAKHVIVATGSNPRALAGRRRSTTSSSSTTTARWRFPKCRSGSA